MSGINRASPSASWSFFSSLLPGLDELGSPAVLGPAEVLGPTENNELPALLDVAELLDSPLEFGSAVVLGSVEAFGSKLVVLVTDESSLFPCVDLKK